MGQLFVTVKDVVFTPSEVFDHTAQLIDTLALKGLSPTVLGVQTDSGVDHALCHVATKFVMIAMFKLIDLDHLVIIRYVPNSGTSIYLSNHGSLTV